MLSAEIQNGVATAELPASFDYRANIATSQKVNWRIEDIIGGDKTLDFSKPFMPESLARVDRLSFLVDFEKLVLNQIRGNTYLAIFGLVEEFILPFVLDHVRPSLSADDFRVNAYLQFAGEEAKHIQLFRQFAEEFKQGFESECKVHRPARGNREGGARPSAAGGRTGDPSNRMDVAASLYRKHKGRPGA